MTDKEYMREVGKRIKDRRDELGMSQEQLAVKIGYKGRSTVSDIEHGRRNINRQAIVALAEALEVSPSYIMGWQREQLIEDLEAELRNLPDEAIRSLLQFARNIKNPSAP